MTVQKLENGDKFKTAIIEDEGKQWPQIVAILIVSLGSFTNGILFVWSSPYSLVVSRDKENYDVTEEDVSMFMFYQPLGMIVTSLVFSPIAELLGRKKTIMVLSVPHIIYWILTIFATRSWEFFIARFIAGIGDTILFSAMPSYVGEISTPSVRGFWGNSPTFFVYGGQAVITVLGSYFNVRISSYICIGIPVVYAILVAVILPESPYQLIKDGKMEEAKRSIRWLNRKNDVEQDFLKIKHDVERQTSESGTWMDLFKVSSNQRALRAGIFLRVSQQFCGISTFATYCQTIFEKAGGNLNAQYSSMIFVSLIWILNCICSVSVEKFGRKVSYFFSLLFSAVILLFMSIYFFIEQFQLVSLDGLNWFPLAGMILFVLTYSPGLGVVPTLMLGELFSASIKSKGLGVLIAVFGLSVLVTTNLFHIMDANIGLYSPFLLYSASCFLSSFLTIKWVPETKGKTLEEIQQSLKIA